MAWRIALTKHQLFRLLRPRGLIMEDLWFNAYACKNLAMSKSFGFVFKWREDLAWLSVSAEGD